MSGGWLLTAETSVHVGDRAALGAADLSVAREALTGWPLLPGSALKGALAERARGAEGGRAAFGADEQRGAIEVHDALLLGLPARLAAGGGALLTSPLALARLRRELGGPEVPRVGIEEACSAEGADRVRIEDLALAHRAHPAAGAWAERIAACTGPGGLGERLLVVHDEVLGHAVRAWTELRYRSAIEPASGTIGEGRPYTIECCPPGTVWWTRGEGLGPWVPRPPEVLVVGGHRGVGLGRVRLCGWEAG